MVELTARFQTAFTYAFDLHREQVRKGSRVPYIAHLMSVSALVMEDGGDEEEAIAGLLHDAVEDQGGQQTLVEIRALFGERVASIVLGCTDTDTIPKPPWRVRKEQYLSHLRDAEPSVVRVSLADKIHNARDVLQGYRELGEDLWSRFQGGKEGTLWYYHELVRIYSVLRQDERVGELARVVGELDALVARAGG